MDGGTYTLVIELAAPRTVTFGAAGDRALAPGWYAYTGTAFGPGGFDRVDRHARVATGANDARHWHVDSLLGHPDARLETAYCTPGVDAECATTDALPADRVPGVGASDCDCPSHLAYAPEREPLVASLAARHDRARDPAPDGD